MIALASLAEATQKFVSLDDDPFLPLSLKYGAKSVNTFQ